MAQIIKKIPYILRSDRLYDILLTLFICASVLGRTIWRIDNETLKFIEENTCSFVYTASFLIICTGRYKKRHAAFVLLMISIAVLSMMGAANNMMLCYMLLIIAADGRMAKRVLRVMVSVQGLLLMLVILSVWLGLTEDYVFLQNDRIRHYLGFNYVTVGAVLYFYLAIGYLCIREQAAGIVELLLLQAVNLFFFQWTDARYCFYLLTVFLAAVLFERLIGYRWFLIKKLKYLLVALPWLIAIFAIQVHAGYDASDPVWNIINETISGRLDLGQRALEEYEIRWFGQPVRWIGFNLTRSENVAGYNYVDCSYVQILIQYGILFLVLVLLLYSVMLYRAIRDESYFLVWGLICVLLLGITEPSLMLLTFNPFPVLTLCASDREIKRERGIEIEKGKFCLQS